MEEIIVEHKKTLYEGIPNELRQCVEDLAENVHKKWAEEKTRQGWTYGSHRDDVKKTSPCLIPYDNLPEHEKDYDRVTAVETIRFLLNNGYKIIKS